MEEPARDAYLELLKQRLTRTYTLGEFRTGGRRHRAVALVMQVLADRGLNDRSSRPVRPSAVRSVRPGSPLLVRMLDRRQLAIVPDESPRRKHRRTGGGLRGRLADLARIERARPGRPVEHYCPRVSST